MPPLILFGMPRNASRFTSFEAAKEFLESLYFLLNVKH